MPAAAIAADVEMCTEQILIKTGGELSQHLARVVTPLLIHDLPVVLWWPDDPPFGTRQFARSSASPTGCSSTRARSTRTAASAWPGWPTVVRERRRPSRTSAGCGWTLWRELLAGNVRPPAAGAGAGSHQDHAHRRGATRPTLRLSRRRSSTWAGWRRASAGKWHEATARA